MSESPETVVIVGAGIVGSALAYFLSQSPTRRNIKIIDRSFSPLLGSTGHAPGFVGQFNESVVLSKLAIDTVAEYTKIPGGFDTVGGLEIAFESDGIERLKSRCADAAKLGLSAEMLSIEEAHKLAPELVNETGPGAAVFFSSDGTANAGEVKKLVISEGRVTGVELGQDSAQRLDADKVILTTGIWAQDLDKDLDFPVPVIPVGHPYMYGKTRAKNARKLPFVRWPEHHVYARDHGERYGIGSYHHEPVKCKATNNTAIGEWIQDFKQPLKFATGLLPPAATEEFKDGDSFNGIFSMTPDNMPLAGKVRSLLGLHMGVAIWVTQAAGTAKFLARLIDGLEVDQQTKEALNPERFRGQDFAALEEKSLQGYNNIYKTIGKQ
ncbi:hypothetical protein NW754_007186 [Fusarium falciforme]|nr:hypothetical protein NW754_007186 [Fusarium falciforme]